MKIALYASAALTATACSSSKPAAEAKGAAADKPEVAPAPAKSDEASTPPAKAPVAAKPAVGDSPDDAPDVDPAAMESDPNATDAVTAIDFKGKAPDDAPVHGTFKAAIGWTDKYGRNAVVFGISEQEKEEEVSSMLVADFLLWEGDAWTSQREFKQAVDACPFDTTLKPMTGDWSVTDLNKDGIGEASFAWRAGCRSDVSPVTHKVFIVGFGPDVEVAKYVLRGSTRLEMGGDIEGSADFKTDDAFSQVPKEFLEHAKTVWEKTSIETL